MTACEKFKQATGLDLLDRNWDRGEELGAGFGQYHSIRDKLRYSGFEHAEQRFRAAAEQLRSATDALRQTGLIKSA